MQSLNNSASQNFSVARIAALLLLMVCGSLAIQGQTNFGRISGTVKDSNGAASDLPTWEAARPTLKEFLETQTLSMLQQLRADYGKQ